MTSSNTVPGTSKQQIKFAELMKGNVDCTF